MGPRSRIRPLDAVLTAAGVAVLASAGAGCSTTSGTDTAVSSTTAATATDDTTARDDVDAADEVRADSRGAAETAELVGDYLREARDVQDAMDARNDTAATIELLRSHRDLLFAVDETLREVDLADADLAETRNTFLETAADTISALDAVTTADAATLTEDDAIAANEGLVAAMGSAADLRFVALALADDGAVPAGPRPSAVLAVPTDVGGDTVHKPEGTLQTTDDGPCGEPSALRAVEPQVYASSFLEDAETSTAQRVLVFTDDDEALDYATAFGAFLDCPSPAELTSTAVEVLDDGTGLAAQIVDLDGITTTIGVTVDGRFVYVVDVRGDQVAAGDDAAAVTTARADEVLAVMEANAA